MPEWLETSIWSFALRAAEAFVWAAPYVLFGSLAAGVLRAWVRPRDLRAALDVSGWPGRARLGLLAFALPWSSFGVLPVARQLRRAGIRPAATLAFLLAGTVLNPLTLAYALSVLPWRAALVFVPGAMIVPLVTAFAAGRKMTHPPDRDETDAPDADTAGTGGRRLLAALAFAAEELTGPMLRDLAIGLAGVGLLAALVPGDMLEHTLAKPGLLATALAVPVAAPAYLPPERGVMVVSVAYAEGNSLGAAFVLLVLGVGVNLASLVWIARRYGMKRLGAVVTLLVALAIGYGLLAEAVLPHLRTAVDHHHALTELGPAEDIGSGREALAHFWTQFRRELQPTPQRVALGCLIALVLSGVGLRVLNRGGAITRWLHAPASSTTASERGAWWNPSLSRRSLAGIGAAGGLALVVVGLYAFFPSPETLIVDLRYTATDAAIAATRGDRQQAIERLDRLDSIVDKLAPGTALRQGGLGPQCRREIDQLRRDVDALRQAVRSGTRDQIRDTGLHVQQTLTRFHRAYDANPAPASLAANGR